MTCESRPEPEAEQSVWAWKLKVKELCSRGTTDESSLEILLSLRDASPELRAGRG